jgi:23S rRNA pseudouridine2605 synthase
MKESSPKPQHNLVASPTPDTPPERSEQPERIAKFLARAGVCSRREAERLIATGVVAVDGAVLTSPAVNITATQRVTVNGQQVATARDPEGRPTAFAALPPEMPRVVSVGRLDLTTEGLLLLTNDGGLARYLELPKHGWTRHYRVRVHGRVSETKLAALADGISIAGVHYAPVIACLERVKSSNAWLNVQINEGKNREVRKIMEHMGLSVTRLIRTAFGPFQLADLPAAAVVEVPFKTLRNELPDYFL